ERSLLARLAKPAEDTYIAPGYVAQGIAFEWCRRGLLEPQIARLKTLYAPRLEACLAAIDREMPDADTSRPDGGFFVSLTLPAGSSTTAVRAAAATRRLNLADGLAFFPDGGGARLLRPPVPRARARRARRGDSAPRRERPFVRPRSRRRERVSRYGRAAGW